MSQSVGVVVYWIFLCLSLLLKFTIGSLDSQSVAVLYLIEQVSVVYVFLLFTMGYFVLSLLL